MPKFILALILTLIILVPNVSYASEEDIECRLFGETVAEKAEVSESGKLFISTSSKLFETIMAKTHSQLKSASKTEFIIMYAGKNQKISNETGNATLINAAELAESCSCFYSFSSSSGRCSIAPRITSAEKSGNSLILRSSNSLAHVSVKTTESDQWTTLQISGAFMIKSVKLPSDAAFEDAIISARVEDGEVITELSLSSETGTGLASAKKEADGAISAQLKQISKSVAANRSGKAGSSKNNSSKSSKNEESEKPKAIKIPKAGSGKHKAISLKGNADKSKGQAGISSSGVGSSEIPEMTLTRTSLKSLDISGGDEFLDIRLTATEPFAYKWMRIKSPDNRFIFDIPSCKMDLPQKEYATDSQIASKIRAAQFEPGPGGSSRAVVDLKIPAKLEIIKESPSSITLRFSKQQMAASSIVMSGYGFTDDRAIKCNPAGVVICIDPGHGGGDCGAVNRTTGLLEKDVTLNISLKLAEKLRRRGFTVVMTRTTDRDVSYAGSPDYEELGARVNAGKNSDLFVSIHINASANYSASGFSTHWSKASDKELAGDIQFSLISKVERKDRGAVKDRLYVTSYSKMPAVLVECGFISNPEEANLLTDDNFINKIVDGIAEGIEIYLSKNPK